MTYRVNNRYLIFQNKISNVENIYKKLQIFLLCIVEKYMRWTYSMRVIEN